MGRTEKFRQQHGEMVQIVKQISGYLTPEKAKPNAAEVSRLLSTLMGKLKVHLAMEDEGLYPSLGKSTDPNVRKLATQYQTEMGNLLPAVGNYAKKWSTPMQIEAAPSDFCKETKGLFEALAKRIERENNELYPMIEKVAA
jgi:hemerythrin-like domain-containing protein